MGVNKRDDYKRSPMTQEEKQELISRIRAMDDDELRIVVDNIPINMLHNRIGRELKAKKELEIQIKSLTNGLR